MLTDRVGQSFTGLVTAVDESKDRVRVQLTDPAVVAYADGHAELGDEVTVRLEGAEVKTRSVDFVLA